MIPAPDKTIEFGEAHPAAAENGPFSMTPDNDIDIEQDDLVKQAEANAARKAYDDSSIQTLDALAHIRQRPACTSAAWATDRTRTTASM